MEEREVESLGAALREGVISQEQYDALVARLQRERAAQVSTEMRRRLLWVGLVLLAILVVFLSASLLTVGQRLVVVVVALFPSVGLAARFWPDPEKFHLSRGLLGLAILEGMVALLLARWERYLGLEPHLAGLVAVTAFGAILGIQQNSTWLASPSFAAFYAGFLTLGYPMGTDFFGTVLGVSIALAVGVVIIAWAWKMEKLVALRDAYERRKTVLGQLARGHFVLFTLYLFPALLFLLGAWNTAQVSLAGLVPFLVALVGVLYARRMNDWKLLSVSSVLLALLAWLVVPFTGVFVWPVAVLVTAGVLIYLGVRRSGGAPAPRA